MVTNNFELGEELEALEALQDADRKLISHLQAQLTTKNQEITQLKGAVERLKSYMLSRQGLDLPILLGFEAGVEDAKEEVEELIDRLAAKDEIIQRLETEIKSLRLDKMTDAMMEAAELLTEDGLRELDTPNQPNHKG